MANTTIDVRVDEHCEESKGSRRMRKLASIQRVKEVLPVITASGVEADSLVLVRFDNVGWQCVGGKKDDYRPGDFVVYIEVSTVLPEHPAFEFMRQRKFKVKTVKFVGTTLSQGLVFPVSILKEFLPPGDEFWSVGEGDDVSALIGVIRYDAEAQDNKTGGEVLGVFPEHIISKTDELRLQSYPFLLERMKSVGDVAATLKYDGTSATFFCENGVVHACSRNLDQRPGNGSVYWKIVEKYNLTKLFEQHPGIVLQGEITAPGIQKNRLGQNGPHLNIFNIWHRDFAAFYSVADVQRLCGKWGLESVQIVRTWGEITFQDETLDSLLELAKGFYNDTKNPREGIVVRPLHQVIFEPRIGTQLSFKVINNDYLLGGGE